MRFGFWTCVVAVVCLLGGADPVFAWGPATHVGLAASVLEHLPLLPAAVAAVLARHGIAFLYGNIAADMVFAKRLSQVKQFCHHWSTAFRLLDTAGDDRARAFAYGYLSHLAADTVAHGKYVPRQIVLSECSIRFGHFFWELRADATVSDLNWRLLEHVLQDDHGYHHEVLESLFTGTLLPYDLNRLLFDGMNALTVHTRFRRTMNVWNRSSRRSLSHELMNGYRAESLDRIHSILAQQTRSPLLREDPNGTSALMHLRVRQREVRQRKRQGLPVERRMLEVLRALAPSPVNSSILSF